MDINWFDFDTGRSVNGALGNLCDMYKFQFDTLKVPQGKLYNKFNFVFLSSELMEVFTCRITLSKPTKKESVYKWHASLK